MFRPESAIPRMSWSPRNLYNLIARSSTTRLVNEFNFTKTSMTMYQQRWRSKRMLRGYHGDWIPERRFKRWFLPTNLPSYAPKHIQSLKHRSKGSNEIESALDTPTPPVKNLFLCDVERRLDTVVFRCCFAHSVYYARSLVLHGKVQVNGEVRKEPGYLLTPGDLITVEPSSVPMLNEHVAKRVQEDREHNTMKKPVLEEAPEVASETLNDASTEAPVEQNDEAQNETTVELKGDELKESKLADSETSQKQTDEKSVSVQQQENNGLPNGVLPFNLPPYAAPFLFIPPYMDVSFRTCSAIYLRHPTLSTSIVRPRNKDQNGGKQSTEVVYRTDIPSPYPADSAMFGLAWELYVRNAPRVRADERRTKLLGRTGNNGFDSARAFEQDRRRVAIRRGWGRKRRIVLPNPSATAASSEANSSI